MNSFWLAVLAWIISPNWCELHAAIWTGGSLPPGRGRLWASIQRRQMFCDRTRSPFQN